MFRRLPRRRPLRPLRMLERANRLFDRGEFTEAALIYEQLAKGAAARRMLNRAGDLYLQAARCHLEAKNIAPALEQSRQALRLFGQAGLRGKIEGLLPRVTQVLREKGYDAEAQAWQAEVEAHLKEMPPGPRPEARPEGPPPGPRPFRWPAFGRPPAARGELPAQCSSCGAPIKPNEVSWIGPNTAECPYCGSSIKAI